MCCELKAIQPSLIIIQSSIHQSSIHPSFFFCYHTLNIYWMLICFFIISSSQVRSTLRAWSDRQKTDFVNNNPPPPPPLSPFTQTPSKCVFLFMWRLRAVWCRSCDCVWMQHFASGGRKKHHPVREVVASPSISFCSVSRHTSCYFSSWGGRSHSLMWSVEMNSFAALFTPSKWSRSWTQTRHFMRVGFIVGCVGFEIGRPQKVNV